MKSKKIDEVKMMLKPKEPVKVVSTIKVGSLVIKYYDNGKRVEYESTKN